MQQLCNYSWTHPRVILQSYLSNPTRILYSTYALRQAPPEAGIFPRASENWSMETSHVSLANSYPRAVSCCNLVKCYEMAALSIKVGTSLFFFFFFLPFVEP